MSTDTLREYEYLWHDKSGKYILIALDEINNIESYAIYNLDTNAVLIIEDNDESFAVKQRMKEEGVQILDSSFLKDVTNN